MFSVVICTAKSINTNINIPDVNITVLPLQVVIPKNIHISPIQGFLGLSPPPPLLPHTHTNTHTYLSGNPILDMNILFTKPTIPSEFSSTLQRVGYYWIFPGNNYTLDDNLYKLHGHKMAQYFASFFCDMQTNFQHEGKHKILVW